LSADRTSVIYNGIDTEKFRPAMRTGQLRRELGLSDEAVLVTAIGQICLRKGQDVFAAAAVQIVVQVPQAHFVVVGSRHSAKTESIAFEAAIADRFAEAGLAERYHPLGERGDVAKILPEADVLVHAARQEPFGRVLLEAAACGVPIVATNVGGTSEMLTDGVHALLVPPDSPQAIADAVLRLAQTPAFASQLGTAASRHVSESFAIEPSARELLSVWQRTITDVDAR
jgi:glycosyltransferase involved in cell wall biosynthesis